MKKETTETDNRPASVWQNPLRLAGHPDARYATVGVTMEDIIAVPTILVTRDWSRWGFPRARVVVPAPGGGTQMVDGILAKLVPIGLGAGAVTGMLTLHPPAPHPWPPEEIAVWERDSGWTWHGYRWDYPEIAAGRMSEHPDAGLHAR